MALFSDFSGGLADSAMRGINGSFAALVGLDVHSEPGILKVAQALAKDSGTTVTELCKSVVTASDGNSYWFSGDSGKIWKRTSTGTWSLAHTNTKGKNFDARQYGDYIYYTADGFLGRQSVATAASEAPWSSADDDFQTLSNGDNEYAPMEEVCERLFIGNGKYVAKFDGTTYVDNALDLTSKFRISALYPYGIDLLIGTYVGASQAVKVNFCKLFRWDTRADDYNDSDLVYEAGINAFIPADNQLYVQAGINGQIYYYNGSLLIPYKNIPGAFTPNAYGLTYSGSVGYFKGRSIFGFSNSPDTANSTGNPCGMGVYSLGRHNKNYPTVLSLEFPVSATSPLASVEIGAIATIGVDLLVSWKKQGGSPTYGVDKLNWSSKYAAAYLETLVVNGGPFAKKSVRFFAGYRSLPANTAVTFSHKKNYASSYTAVTGNEIETDTKLVSRRDNMIDIRAIQMKVAFTTATNDAPELDYLGLDFEE
jgi:hypothetical protein